MSSVALVQAGTFRSDAGNLFGPVPWVLWGGLVTDEVDDKRRLLQALNCLLIETPSGRVVVETGIGERLDDKTRAMRSYEGPWIASVLETVGFMPESVNIVALSHLHFDHAGGLLRADGSRAFPHAKIVAQQAEWEVALGDNPRLVASYVQPELKLVETLGKQGWVDGEQEIMPGVSVVPTGGHSAGHQAIVVRGTGDGARTLAFFGDLMMRPWAANPRWVTAFDDFPLDSVVQKAALFAPGRRRGLDRGAVARVAPPDRAAGPRPRPVPLRAGLTVGLEPPGLGIVASRRAALARSKCSSPRMPFSRWFQANGTISGTLTLLRSRPSRSRSPATALSRRPDQTDPEMVSHDRNHLKDRVRWTLDILAARLPSDCRALLRARDWPASGRIGSMWAAAPASSRGAPTIDEMTPLGSMNTWVGRP